MTKLNSLKTLFIFIVSVIINSSLIYSTTLIKVTFDRLVRDSDFIFIGDVIDISYRWGDRCRTVNTYVTFGNIEVLTNNYYENSFTLKFTGGQKGPYRLEVPGIPLFEIGQRSVIFARSKTNGSALCPLVGWCQGRFGVFKDQETGIDAVYDDAGNLVTGIDNFDIQKKYLNNRNNPLNKLTKNDFNLHDFITKIKGRLSLKAAHITQNPESVLNIEIPEDIDCQINEKILTQPVAGEKPKKKKMENLLGGQDEKL